MSDLHAFYGPNAGYVLEQYDRYISNPASVSTEFQQFFASFDPSTLEAAAAGTPEAQLSTAPRADQIEKIVAVVQLATGLREYGHLAVPLDPIGTPPPGAPEIELSSYGLTDDDLRKIPASAVGGKAAEGASNAHEAMTRLRYRYTTRMGFDFDQVQIAEEREWLENAAESGDYDYDLTDDQKKDLLKRLTAVEGFEQFIHKTYPGVKRFSIEGLDMVVPMLDLVIEEAAEAGAREVVLGMAHRGRLNVLVHTMNRPYGNLIAQFENRHDEAQPPSGFNLEIEETRSGDVKYHMGARLTRHPVTGETLTVPIALAPNPSHLEAVNPVVMGMTRAAQDDRAKAGPARQHPERAVGILLHGDAAFAGLGINAETMNMNALKGFTTGGTVHIIENNNIGYTTLPSDSRSTTYAADPAKGFEIPVIHVNADDVIACLSAINFAMAYRKKFHKDFVIDCVGYRRYGHNEGDEPLYTQPVYYTKIQKHPTVRAIFAEQLAKDGVLSLDESKAMEKEFFDKLAKIRRGITEGEDTYPMDWIEPMQPSHGIETRIEYQRLDAIDQALHEFPEGFGVNRKLGRQLQQRSQVVRSEDGLLDWGHAESIAFASILQDGTPIRFSGEDSQRGTFNHRHLVLHDSETGDQFTPMYQVPDVNVSFTVYNSPLSEFGVMGWEYGYNQNAPECLVIWEGQFGDFANGAQTVIDQFISGARSKWGEKPSLVLLLPHGYEGQGPEHSNARPERFLQLAAEDNMRVANVSSSGQYFHLLRFQAKTLLSDPRPLVVFTPKSLLRNPMAASPVSALTDGEFKPVLDDPRASGRKDLVTRLVLCTGKVAIDLEQSPLRDSENVAVARVEMLAPFQRGALRDVISSYPNLKEIVWVQEEPRNMGAWTYMGYRLRDLVEDRIPVRYIGRPDQASPAEGYATKHKENQERIVAAAFADVLPPDSVDQSSQDSNGSEDSASRKREDVSVATAD